MNFDLDQPGEGRAANVEYDAVLSSYSLFYPCQSQSICTSYKSSLKAGRYLLEVWGSQGGSYQNGKGGKGGYSRGVLSLSQTTLLFFTIGGRSSAKEINGYCNSDESFNGGGKSGFNSNEYSGSPGGGGTDIRALKNDFSHRILVAGGGGGGGQWSSSYQGGFGGGEIGGDGIKYDLGYPGSKGGNQNSGGIGGSYSRHPDQSGGEFGKGSSTVYQGSGGGGGWYGGSAGFDVGSGGGGGSGYVNNATSIKPSSYPFNNSFFLEKGLKEGNHNSNIGYIKITILFTSKEKHCQDKCPPNNNLLNFLISHYFLFCIVGDSNYF